MAAFIDQQVQCKIFVIAGDGRELQRGLKQRVQNVKARLVGSKPGALLLHAAKRPHGHRAVFLAVPGATPVLQLQQLLGSFVDKILDAVLVRKPVPTTHGVVKVQGQAVILLDNARRTAFGGTRVATHGVNLGDECNFQRQIGLSQCNGSPQTRSACANNGDICFYDFHVFLSIT